MAIMGKGMDKWFDELDQKIDRLSKQISCLGKIADHMMHTNGPGRVKQEVTLYKKNGSKVQQWTIEQDEYKYRTTEGFVGGAMTTTEWTIAQPKNTGKKNATTGPEQAFSEVSAKIKLKIDKGYTLDKSGEGLDRFEPMLAHKYEDHVKKLAPYIVPDDTCILGLETNMFSQPKLDGMRCNATEEEMVSRQGKPVICVPHILRELKESGAFEMYPGLVVDGELYNHSLKDNFNRLISYVRKSKPTAADLEDAADIIEYHVYDIYLPDQPTLSFSERWKIMVSLFFACDKIHLVRTDNIYTQQQMDERYSMYREQGYEGQMIRLDGAYVQGRTHMLLKRKEFQDAEYEILDILEGVGNRSGMMGKFILKAGDETFESNGLGNQDYYRQLLQDKKEYIGKLATVRFQNLTPRGVPRFPCVVTIRDYE